MKKISIVFLSLFYCLTATAQLAAWDFTGENAQLSSVADISSPELSFVPVLSRGAGAPPSSAVNSFRTTGFQNNGLDPSNSDYFEFSLAASTGYRLSFSSISSRMNGTASFAAAPGVSHQYMYSTDGNTFFPAGSVIVTTGTNQVFTVDLSVIPGLQHITAGTTVTFRLFVSGQTSTGGWGYFSGSAGQLGLAVEGNLAPVSGIPLLQVSPPVLTDFTAVQGNISAEQSCQLSGTNLSGAVNITAPAGFEISGQSGTGFSGSMSVLPVAGSVNTTLYVRMNTSVPGSQNGVLSFQSAGASPKEVSLQGLVLRPEPSSHVSGFMMMGSSASTITTAWTDAGGSVPPEGYLLKWSDAGFAAILPPADGIPEPDGPGRINIGQGIQTVILGGLIQNRVYYCRIFPYTNTGAYIDYKTDGLIPEISGTTAAGAWEDFETGSKTGYAAGNVTCSAGNWNLTDALLGTDANDRKNGVKSVRIRNGYAQMNFDISNGVGIVQLYHAVYGADANGTWKLEASNDGGNTWGYSSAEVISSSTQLTPAIFPVNMAGNVRLRIIKTDGGTNRINIDDITYTQNAALPVKFAEVKAQRVGNAIRISWSNLTETDMLSYSVQRMKANGAWEELVSVKAAKNDGGRADYQYMDQHPADGVNLYRIEANETDGKKLYSVILRADTKNTETGISVFPNPVTEGVFSLQLNGLARGIYQAGIYNLSGQQVRQIVISNKGNNETEMISLPAGLKPGLYTIRINTENGPLNKLFLVK